jgi:hypothetical protein
MASVAVDASEMSMSEDDVCVFQGDSLFALLRGSRVQAGVGSSFL